MKRAETSIEYSEATKKFIIENQGNVILIIGVVPGEEMFHERFDALIETHKIVFAYIAPAQDDRYAFIKINCSDIAALKELASNFPHKFKNICTDGVGTTKFLVKFTKEHIEILNSALVSEQSKIVLHDQVEFKFYDNTTVKLATSSYLPDTLLNDTYNSLKQSLSKETVFLQKLAVPSSLTNSCAVDANEMEATLKPVSDIVQLYKEGLETMGSMLTRLRAVDAPAGAHKMTDGQLKEHLERASKQKQFLKDNSTTLTELSKLVVTDKFNSWNLSARVENLNSYDNLFMPKDHIDTDFITYLVYSIEGWDEATSTSLAGQNLEDCC